MCSDLSDKKKPPSFFDIDDSSLKDLKFCICSFLAIVLIIIHYAWIMRQWVLDPSLPNTTLAFYSFTLIGTVVLSFGILGKVAHSRIYGTSQEKAQEKKVK